MLNKALYEQMVKDPTFSFDERVDYFLETLSFDAILKVWNSIVGIKNLTDPNPAFGDIEERKLLNHIYNDVDLMRYIEGFGVDWVTKHITIYDSEADFITMDKDGLISTITDEIEYLDLCGCNEVVIEFLKRENAVDHVPSISHKLMNFITSLLKEYDAFFESRRIITNKPLKEGDFFVLWVKPAGHKGERIRICYTKEEVDFSLKEMLKCYVADEETLDEYMKEFHTYHALKKPEATVGCFLRNHENNECVLN